MHSHPRESGDLYAFCNDLTFPSIRHRARAKRSPLSRGRHCTLTSLKCSLHKKSAHGRFFVYSIIAISAFQNLQYLLQFHTHLADDLMAAADIVLRGVTLKLLAGATDGETLLVK